ncbi:uncharacterized protein METZ01_LOCUS289411, partial [marine metagenome]
MEPVRQINIFPEKIYVGMVVLLQCRHAKGNSTPYAS